MSTRPERSATSAATSAVPRKLDLSRIRHDLRTPINHILGYCEMLMEEQQVPAPFAADLQKIHAGGRQLVSLINEYFDDENFEAKKRDLHQLCHELRTPVNHIIGYTELIQEQLEGAARKKVLPDLKRIHAAAITWLALTEEYLIAPESDRVTPIGPQSVSIAQGMGFQVPGEDHRAPFDGSILVVDDDEANRDMLARRLRRHGVTVTLAASGLEALKLMRAQPFDVVLLDLIMPGFDGYQVLVKMKAEPALRDIAVIMVSALDQEEGVARCIEMGAEDYLAKPFNPVFLRARIGACLEKKRLRERERATLRDLQQTQHRLAGELEEAADYVRSLLPHPIKGDISADWRFVPSAELGGDVLNYFWLDADRLAIFVVDVCGHGVAAAIFSITISNMLRPGATPGLDFGNPANVLTRLNKQFPMEQHNQMYFTIWYGVYQRSEQKLRYASGGHPPAVLLPPEVGDDSEMKQLRTPGVVIGYQSDSNYTTQECVVTSGSVLFVFSDGAYEIAGPDGKSLQLEDLVAELHARGRNSGALDEIVAWARAVRGRNKLDDDLSIVQVRF
jgi:sigma-B regulation protein RsbU (phosphoserine phosphatase)